MATATDTATDTVIAVEAPAASAAAPIMTHRQIMLVIYGLMSGMFLSSLAQTVFGTAIRPFGAAGAGRQGRPHRDREHQDPPVLSGT